MSQVKKRLKKNSIRRVVPIRAAFAEIASEETPFIRLLSEEEQGILERIAKKLLAPRELEVYSRRNRLFGEGVESQTAIARDFKVTKQRIKQIEQRAVEKMMANYRSALAVVRAEIFHERYVAEKKRRAS